MKKLWFFIVLWFCSACTSYGTNVTLLDSKVTGRSAGGAPYVYESIENQTSASLKGKTRYNAAGERIDDGSAQIKGITERSFKCVSDVEVGYDVLERTDTEVNWVWADIIPGGVLAGFGSIFLIDELAYPSQYGIESKNIIFGSVLTAGGVAWISHALYKIIAKPGPVEARRQFKQQERETTTGCQFP